MTWTPAYQSELTDPLVRQLIAIVQRDQRAALDWVAGQDVLEGIKDYQLAAKTLPEFPYVYIYDDETVFDQDAVGSRHYSVRLYCEVAVSNQDYEMLAVLRRQYVRAIDMVLTTVPLSDFYLGLDLDLPILGNTSVKTEPLQNGSVKELFVVRHRMGRIGKVNQGFAASALIEFHIDREEI